MYIQYVYRLRQTLQIRRYNGICEIASNGSWFRRTGVFLSVKNKLALNRPGRKIIMTIVNVFDLH